MGEARRRRAAQTQRFKVGDAEVIGVARDSNSPFSLPHIPDAGAMICEIGRKGEMTRDLCREAADWTAGALDTQPGLLLALTVGGFDDDPREVLDIPEARQAFAWFGQRLEELDNADGSARLLNRLESLSRNLVLIAMGYLTPDHLSYEDNPAAVQRQWEEDDARVRNADARYRAEQAAKANQGGKQ
jgi:hypothetical protein